TPYAMLASMLYRCLWIRFKVTRGASD
ncbi:uncharacterized protein METZ01_LOCUS14993, partial [marine metagenome]